MADITSIIGQQSAQASINASSNSSALGQEEFLNLLVAQLQHQDPLNPSDPTEFTAQLAQYSQLEQLFNLNDSMEQLALAQNNSQRISALSLLGKEILVSGDTFDLGENPVEIGYRVDGTVMDATLHITDQYGKSIDIMELDDLGRGNHTLTWDGLDDEGNQVDPGTYSIAIQFTGSENTASGVSPLVRSEVTGVEMEEGVPMLVTDAGEYTVDAIHGAYE